MSDSEPAKLAKEHDQLGREHEQLRAEHEQMRDKHDVACAERDEMKREAERLLQECEFVSSNYATSTAEAERAAKMREEACKKEVAEMAIRMRAEVEEAERRARERGSTPVSKSHADAMVERLTKENTALIRDNEELGAELRTSRERIERMGMVDAECQSLRDEVAALKAAAEDAELAAGAAGGENAVALIAVKKELAAVKKELATAKNELAEVTTVKDELATVKDELTTVKNELATANNELSATTAHLQTTQHEVAQLDLEKREPGSDEQRFRNSTLPSTRTRRWLSRSRNWRKLLRNRKGRWMRLSSSWIERSRSSILCWTRTALWLSRLRPS